MRDIAITLSGVGRAAVSNSVLGYQAETSATRLVIQVEAWHKEGCTWGLQVQGEDGRGWTAFAGATPDVMGLIGYVVDSRAMAKAGRMELQFERNDGEGIMRSERLMMQVLESVMPGDPPADDMPAWYEQMQEAAHELGLAIQGGEALYEDMETAKDATQAAAGLAQGYQAAAEAAADTAITKAGEASLSAQQAQAAVDKLDGTEIEVNVVGRSIELWLTGMTPSLDIEVNGRNLEVYQV